MRTFPKIITVQELTLAGLRSIGDATACLARARGSRPMPGRSNSAFHRHESTAHERRIVASLRIRPLAAEGRCVDFHGCQRVAAGYCRELRALPALNRYPDPTSDTLRDAIAAFYRLGGGT